MIGITLSVASNFQEVVLTSTYSSGTDSKNISVANPLPPIRIPAVTPKAEGVKPLAFLTKDCRRISSISSGVKILPLPASDVNAFIFFVRIR